MATFGGPNTIETGLIVSVDAANPTSYPGSGTTWRDLSGNNNSGSLVNGPTFNSVNGGSIVFDGSNDYVNIPYAGNTSNSFTFTIVMKCNNMDSNTSLNRQTLFGLSQNGNAAFRQFDVEIWGNTGVGFRGNGGAVENVNFFSYSWTLGVNANNINIYTITLNSTGHSIYVNGVLRNTISQTATADFNSIVLGTRLSENLWSGSCFNFSMYNRALALTEIQQNFNAMRGRFGI